MVVQLKYQVYSAFKELFTRRFKERVYGFIQYIKYSLFGMKNTEFQIVELGRPNYHTFFGYYDISPFDYCTNKLLAMELSVSEVYDKNSFISVGFFDLNDEERSFKKIGESSLWCWQQGCRLQWYPSNDDGQIIYNKMVGDSYGAVVQDINSHKIKTTYPTPIYAVSSDGKNGLSLNFSRLQRLRPGYGYDSTRDDTVNIKKPKDDGVWLVNMEDKSSKLLFSVDDISNIQPLDSMGNAQHYFNHLLFNPCGKRFMFIHLWMDDTNRYSRLITSDIEGRDICVLNNDGHTSHYAWKTDEKILSYSTHEDTGTHFYLYRDQTEEKSIVGREILMEDGHPSFSKDSSTILLDTYPNIIREQKLYLYNINNENTISLGSFFSSLKYTGDVRCDLHPRWSSDNRYVCIDSVHNGVRAMYVVDTQGI